MCCAKAKSQPAKQTKRDVAGFGIHPIAGFVIILTAFYSFIFYRFTKTAYASYLYILIAMSIVFKYKETNRNELLKFTFTKADYFRIRVLENLLTIVPFIIFLCIKKELNTTFLLIVLSSLMPFINNNKRATLTILTPFYR